MALTEKELKESTIGSIGRLSVILKFSLFTEKDKKRAIDLLKKIEKEVYFKTSITLSKYLSFMIFIAYIILFFLSDDIVV